MRIQNGSFFCCFSSTWKWREISFSLLCCACIGWFYHHHHPCHFFVWRKPKRTNEKDRWKHRNLVLRTDAWRGPRYLTLCCEIGSHFIWRHMRGRNWHAKQPAAAVSEFLANKFQQCIQPSKTTTTTSSSNSNNKKAHCTSRLVDSASFKIGLQLCPVHSLGCCEHQFNLIIWEES